MVTLGIYRFWLITDVRRFLWSNTEIDGETLEYAGTPLELLIGFLIAIAMLIPVYAGFFIAALDLGVFGEMTGAIAFAGLAVLGQYAIYRARRYRLTRTVFRGLRFTQTGSALGLRLPRGRLVDRHGADLRPRIPVPARGFLSATRCGIPVTRPRCPGRFAGTGFGLMVAADCRCGSW